MKGRHAIALVGRREIRERLRGPAFLASTVILLVLVGGSSALSATLDTQKTYAVAVTTPAPAGLDAALQQAAKPFDAKVSVHRVDSARHHLPPTPELTTATLEPPKSESSDAETLAAMLGATLLLGSLAVYGQWVLTGVVEEKDNRVVELILASVRPRHLLAGKVIGIGLLGLTQVALVAGLAAALIGAGLFDAPASLSGSVALVVPWFALGYALYSVAYAAAGALASQQQDASSAGLPVTYTLLAAFFGGYVTLTANADGFLAHVLTLFPLTAPFVLPARSALVGVPFWEHALAVVLVLASIYALIRFAGRVYSHGLLRGGTRVDLRGLWRLARARSPDVRDNDSLHRDGGGIACSRRRRSLPRRSRLACGLTTRPVKRL